MKSKRRRMKSSKDREPIIEKQTSRIIYAMVSSI